ncbi:MAG: patatin-like phospholipase family protein [Gemmatimonadota bacterium]|nr:patatin-like phospholipase family protein [Gemmatimonadota bacterium]
MTRSGPARSFRAEAGGPEASVVLSGGGARGAYQVGVMQEIAARRPGIRFPVLTGVSAGAINAAVLAGRAEAPAEALDDLAGTWGGLRTRDVLRSDAVSLAWNALRLVARLGTGGGVLAPQVRGLVDTSPLFGLLERIVDPDGIERNIEAGRLRAAAVSATSYRTGRTVTFVHAAPDVRLWERARQQAVAARLDAGRVMASAAIPLFFPAAEVEGEWFGDGGIRQGNPLSPAVRLGARRILAVSSRYRPSRPPRPGDRPDPYPPAGRVAGLVLNSIFLDNLDVDAERLQRINRLVTRIPREHRWRVDERPVRLLVLRPSADLGRMAARHESRLPRAFRFLVRGLDGRSPASSDLLSYLLFEREYLGELLELGRRDVDRNWVRIRRFLAEPGKERA